MQEFHTKGRVLYITEDPELIRQQISGENLDYQAIKGPLRKGISTDDLIPAKFGVEDADAERLGKHLLRGLGDDIISEDDIKKSGFEVIVLGESAGRGSSREHAQLALLGAGIKIVITESTERIFFENCVNYGLPVLTLESEHVQSFLKNEYPISLEHYLNSLKPISRLIAESGGLLELVKSRLEGKSVINNQGCAPRPMTAVEKIIASHAGVDYVQPGEQYMIKIDHGFFYELQAEVMNRIMKKYGLDGFPAPYADRFVAFEDHLALADFPFAEILRSNQRKMANKLRVPLYRIYKNRGVEGICHTVMSEKYILPGQVVLGNDSHTCSAGFMGAYATGKGASEVLAALFTGDIFVTVPETIKFHLKGRLQKGVTASDLIRSIIGSNDFRNKLIGSERVFEFSGPALEYLTPDERFTIANMSIEGQAATSFIEADKTMYEWISRIREKNTINHISHKFKSDHDAEFVKEYEIDLSEISPVISLPGDPQNTINLSDINEKIQVDIAYLGSCTGGKLEDLIRAARVLEGRQINPRVRLYVQAGSQRIRNEIKRMGILDILLKAGVQFLLPGCGACMGMGPGTSKKGETTISDTNRNFNRRMGEGLSYLANPEVVAASAINGFICSPTELR